VAADRGTSLGSYSGGWRNWIRSLRGFRDHLQALDLETARSLGLYEDAKAAAEERKAVEGELSDQAGKLPRLPSVKEIRSRAAAAFDALEEILASATIEERRAIIGKYVRAVQVDPDRKTVRISLYTALFNQMVAGQDLNLRPLGYEPILGHFRRFRRHLGLCPKPFSRRDFWFVADVACVAGRARKLLQFATVRLRSELMQISLTCLLQRPLHDVSGADSMLLLRRFVPYIRRVLRPAASVVRAYSARCSGRRTTLWCSPRLHAVSFPLPRRCRSNAGFRVTPGNSRRASGIVEGADHVRRDTARLDYRGYAAARMGPATDEIAAVDFFEPVVRSEVQHLTDIVGQVERGPFVDRILVPPVIWRDDLLRPNMLPEIMQVHSLRQSVHSDVGEAFLLRRPIYRGIAVGDGNQYIERRVAGAQARGP